MLKQFIYPQLKLPVKKTCQVCGKPLTEGKLDLSQIKGTHLFVVEAVPVYTCEYCDETWVPQEVLDGFRTRTSLRSVKHGGTKSQHRKAKT